MAPSPPTSYVCHFCGEVVPAGDEITIDIDTGKTQRSHHFFPGGTTTRTVRVMEERDFCSYDCARAGRVVVALIE